MGSQVLASMEVERVLESVEAEQVAVEAMVLITEAV